MIMKIRNFAVLLAACLLPSAPVHAADRSGFQAQAPLAALGGTAWRDENRNGVLDGGEPGVPNVAVTVLDRQGAVAHRATTGSDGRWLVIDVSFDSSYRVCFDAGPGLTPTVQDAPGSTRENASRIDSTGCTAMMSVTAGQVDLHISAGYIVG
ncbi:SdrD B-like domain-containing protein [Streptomyces sp. NPDC001407]|uniref:SdrD B-like domain-containing protein n=1 Tax=Streptomyces sp. NPDC001407 TaxID=3364573 RepID=UPI0036B1DE3C